MRHVLAALAIVLSLAFTQSGPADVQARVVVLSAKVFLNANATSLVLTSVPAGTVLAVEQREKDWIRVSLPGAGGTRRIGYVRQTDIEILETDRPRPVAETAPKVNPVTPPRPIPPPSTETSAGSNGPAWIDAALALGQQSKSVSPIALGRRKGLLERFSDWKKDPGIAFFTTPYVRVALAAEDARRKLKPIAAGNISAWMLEPVLTVYVPQYEDLGGGRVTNTIPEHVVIRAVGSSAPNAAVQPIGTRPYDESKDWIVQVGETRTGDGLIADFPLQSLKVGNEFYVVFRRSQSSIRSQDSNMQTMAFKITADMLALAGCPLACR